MSELHKASVEEALAFQEDVHSDPALIGQVITEAIEKGILTIPDEDSPVVTTEELKRFDFTAARKAQKEAMLHAQLKALTRPHMNVTKER